MLETTKCILLRSLKYSDNSLICSIYTEKFGRKNVIFKGLNAKKKKKNVLQSLALLEVVIYHHPKRDVHLVKEFSLYRLYETIPFDMHKRTIALFMAELLYKVLQEESPNQELFDFLQNSFIHFDETDKNIIIFHVIFLMKLTKYLGIEPLRNFSTTTPYFNLQSGTFVAQKTRRNVLDKAQSKAIAQLQKMNYQTCIPDDLLRYRYLKILTRYYALHLDDLSPIKSLEVLKIVFR